MENNPCKPIIEGVALPDSYFENSPQPVCFSCIYNKGDIYCQGCGSMFCRRRCWRFHDCGRLTDRNGWLVKVGSVVAYPGRPEKTYTLLETEPTIMKSKVMYGRSKKEEKRIVYVRLTELQV